MCSDRTFTFWQCEGNLKRHGNIWKGNFLASNELALSHLPKGRFLEAEDKQRRGPLIKSALSYFH